MSAIQRSARPSSEENTSGAGRPPRPLSLTCPFELHLQVVEAGGLLIGGQIRAEVLVDGVIVGLTDRQTVKQLTATPCERGIVSWPEQQGVFTVPLTSMVAHSIRVNLYRESRENRKGTIFVGCCQRDQRLERLWSHGNR